MPVTQINQPTENGRPFPIEYFYGYPDEVYSGHQINGVVIQQADHYKKTVFYTFLDTFDTSHIDGHYWRVRPATDSLQARLFARGIDDLPF